MRENKSVAVQAKSVDLALKKAAEQLGVQKEGLGYELISQTDAGFLSFLGGRKVEIKAWSNAAPVQEKRRQEPRSQRNSEDDETAELINREPLDPQELERLVEDL